MRYLLAFLSLFCWQLSSAQSFIFPKLPTAAQTIAALTPVNWKAIDTAYGDLNNDKLADLILVLEYHQSVKENRAYGSADEELIQEFQKPRILAIYFKNAQNKYAIALQNNNFILRSQEGGALGEPFKNLSITNNTLNLAFAGGANWRWKLNYQFKYQNKDWVLIQANNVYYNASSGEMTDKQYNFTTRRMKQTTGNLFTRNVANQVFEDVLLFTDLRTLNTFKKPWTWEITKDNFL
jgi:hypothetical protein